MSSAVACVADGNSPAGRLRRARIRPDYDPDIAPEAQVSRLPARMAGTAAKLRSPILSRGGDQTLTLYPIVNAAAVFSRLAAIAILLTAGLRSQQTAQLRPRTAPAATMPGRASGNGRREFPPGFTAAALKASPHAALDCVACHSDITVPYLCPPWISRAQSVRLSKGVGCHGCRSIRKPPSQSSRSC
jgi:hypothetical protein